jgi:hypothetical protein
MHQSTDLRETLKDFINFPDLPQRFEFELQGKFQSGPTAVCWLLEQFTDCDDTLPSRECQLLELPPGSTYAQAAEDLKSTLAGGGWLTPAHWGS